ncbi:hypothetical protein CSOJ01_12532 [Colletotrichum sojae]|uniref:Uncharacterized protein n=1 Tax=Colletotrichum sojae TaxID=2175907 RepID=A0A8H6IV69_9PEZI|nr:hypothetical protein CSOJ01_12532 [Colletotrichum sojae]
MAVNELLNERRYLKPKDIGLIKANVTAWEGVMAEIQEKCEAKKAWEDAASLSGRNGALRGSRKSQLQGSR